MVREMEHAFLSGVHVVCLLLHGSNSMFCFAWHENGISRQICESLREMHVSRCCELARDGQPANVQLLTVHRKLKPSVGRGDSSE